MSLYTDVEGHEVIVIRRKLLASLCFHDAHVEKIEFFKHENILKFYISHASILDSSDVFFREIKDACLEKVILVFKNWNKLSVYRYNQHGEQPIALHENEFEQIRDIAMFEANDDCIRISGFGVEAGHWVDWVVIGAHYYAEFQSP